MPARLPSAGQVGLQTQRPCTHRPAAPQLPLHRQVSMQMPSLQALPASQETPAQRSGTHLPFAQLWRAGQVTLAHGSAEGQLLWHAVPGAQAASQASRAVHLPVPGSQNWPAAHVTPAQGTTKQPGMQLPSTQVCLSGHVYWYYDPPRKDTYQLGGNTLLTKDGEHGTAYVCPTPAKTP